MYVLDHTLPYIILGMPELANYDIEDQFNLSQSVTKNKCELRKEVKDIIKNFGSDFSKDKYDFGALRVEPQRIVLNSDLPVGLRPYRTSPVDEQEIKSQVEKLLQAGLIKESNVPIHLL
ncbi:hypothetical protein AVEN_157836-1 [Araneus ventricosus]|uniref:Uncharacterized protein n=1 Tax=Araneus ventricosus TaxID=182803 RepID=A0A4Y2E604_ARAVE|nr:hypothetical protein AVEN_157836-1 [Araneus ventricosus]